MSKHHIYTTLRDMKYFTSKSFQCRGCSFHSNDYAKAKQHAITENYNDAIDECVYPDVNNYLYSVYIRRGHGIAPWLIAKDLTLEQAKYEKAISANPYNYVFIKDSEGNYV